MYYFSSISVLAKRPIPEFINLDYLISILSSYESGYSQNYQRTSSYCWLDQFILININLMGQFCYWDAKSLGDTIILIVLAVIVAIIGTITIYRLRRSRHLGLHGKKIMLIYILVMGWCIIMFGQLIYSIAVFFAYLYQNPRQSIVPFARYFVRFDILPGFIVQTIFLTICRYYYKGLTGAIQICHLSKWEQSYISYLNFYYRFRIAAQAIGLCLVNVFALSNNISLFSQINLWILIFDSVIMNIYLILSLKIYLKAVHHIRTISRREVKTLKIQYSLMIATSIMRVIIDIIFLMAPLFQQEEKQSLCVINDFSTHIMTSIFYNIFGNLINHIFPIVWILKIYSFETQKDNSDEYSQMEDPIKRSCLL